MRKTSNCSNANIEEKELYPRYMANTQNIENSKKEDMERSILVLHC